MDGAGKKLWGYDKDNDVWVPLQVDADGVVKVDMSVINLDDLGDVEVPNPALGDLLVYDLENRLWVNIALEDLIYFIAAAMYLDDLADVCVPGPHDNDFLYWDEAASLWKCKQLSGAVNLDDLGDVVLTDVQMYDMLQWDTNNAKWMNINLSDWGPMGCGAALLDAINDVDVPSPGDQYFLYRDDATQLWKCRALVVADIPTTIKTFTIGIIIGDGVNVITTGQKGHIPIDFACTIKQVTMAADVSGSIVVDIWKDTYASFPPTDADSITASAPPTISASQKSQDATLTGWTTAIAAGDILAFNVDSCTTITRVTISLKVERT